MNRYAILSAALVLAAPSLAQRGSSGDVWKYLAAKYDKDQDGKITKAEYPRGEAKFASYDRDRNGVVTQSDFAGGGNRRRGGNRNRGGRNTPNTTGIEIAVAIASNADDNEDGRVTAGEWNKSLASLDHNSDKIVSPAEISEIMCAALGRKRLSSRAVARRSRHLDTNKDKVVQLSELAAMFGKMDKNSDKVLSRGELGSAKPVRISGPPKVGQVAPDFELPTVDDAKKLVKLSSFRGKKPVALIFGSYT